MRLTAEVVNQMTSVERVLEYTKIVKERDLETHPGKYFLLIIDTLDLSLCQLMRVT
jgi:hypothetical protein